MNHSTDTETMFQEVLDNTPNEIKLQVDWSYDIADWIYKRLHELGVSQKDFAHRMGTSEAVVSRWIGGGYNFTLSTLAKISSVLGSPIITVKK